MTDNRTTELTATERICEQLEAAGVSFVRSEQIIEGTYWGVTWFVGETKFEFRENDKRTDLIAFNATPEQAIAATLVVGTLTAEQVRTAIFNGSSYASYDGAKYYADGIVMQAIADELNELGSGTCKLEPLSALDVTLNMLDQTEWGACSECGCAVPMDARFCNECGKAVSE